MFLASLGIWLLAGASTVGAEECTAPTGFHFPPAGQLQLPQSESAVGLDPNTVERLRVQITEGNWILLRHGHLVHLESDPNTIGDVLDVKSLRKTFHAANVGAAIQAGTLPGIDQTLSTFSPELVGHDAAIRWFDVLAQTSALDEPNLPPGSLWAYSDANPLQLNRALARAYGKADEDDHYEDVIGPALLDPIGVLGWSVKALGDGIRVRVNLSGMARLGILLTADGCWNGTRILPEGYAADIATKQTAGIPPNYMNANDGNTDLLVEDFPESPYGLMSWSNSDGDLWPAAGTGWALGLGLNGSREHHVAWNAEHGLVLAIQSGRFAPYEGNPPGWPLPARGYMEQLEASVVGDNPLLGEPCTDSDGDGVCDGEDNCPAVPNPGQSDQGGVGESSGADGIGDVCQCGDVDDDGLVTDTDVDQLRQQLAALSNVTEPDKCAVTTPGSCGLSDAVAMRRALQGVGALAPVCAP